MKISPYRQVKVKSDMSSLFVIKWYKVCKINTTSMNVKKKRVACQKSLITHEMVLSNPKRFFQFKLYDVVVTDDTM